jgi:uncharacterized protein with GYD domain
MTAYIILSRFSPGAFRNPGILQLHSKEVSTRIKSECSGVHWKGSFATMGDFDAVNIFEVEDPEQIEKVAAIISAGGYSKTEILAAAPWKEFMKNSQRCSLHEECELENCPLYSSCCWSEYVARHLTPGN